MKRKLKIDAFKVSSFITDDRETNMNTVKGGTSGFTLYTLKCTAYTYCNNCTAVNCGSANPC